MSQSSYMTIFKFWRCIKWLIHRILICNSFHEWRSNQIEIKLALTNLAHKTSNWHKKSNMELAKVFNCLNISIWISRIFPHIINASDSKQVGQKSNNIWSACKLIKTTSNEKEYIKTLVLQNYEWIIITNSDSIRWRLSESELIRQDLKSLLCCFIFNLWHHFGYCIDILSNILKYNRWCIYVKTWLNFLTKLIF